MPRSPAASPKPQPAAADVDALRRLGQRVRSHRHEQGLTLRELAARTGLSTPFLSQVENGVGTPSLTSLFSLARVLGSTAEALLAGPEIAPVAVIRADQGTRYPVSEANDDAFRRQLTSAGEPFSAAEYLVPAGTDLGGFEASNGRDLLHVLAGSLTVEVRADGAIVTNTLHTGDTIVYNTTDEHRWSVAATIDTRFLHIVATPAG